MQGYGWVTAVERMQGNEPQVTAGTQAKQSMQGFQQVDAEVDQRACPLGACDCQECCAPLQH